MANACECESLKQNVEELEEKLERANFSLSYQNEMYELAMKEKEIKYLEVLGLAEFHDELTEKVLCLEKENRKLRKENQKFREREKVGRKKKGHYATPNYLVNADKSTKKISSRKEIKKTLFEEEREGEREEGGEEEGEGGGEGATEGETDGEGEGEGAGEGEGVGVGEGESERVGAREKDGHFTSSDVQENRKIDCQPPVYELIDDKKCINLPDEESEREELDSVEKINMDISRVIERETFCLHDVPKTVEISSDRIMHRDKDGRKDREREVEIEEEKGVEREGDEEGIFFPPKRKASLGKRRKHIRQVLSDDETSGKRDKGIVKNCSQFSGKGKSRRKMGEGVEREVELGGAHGKGEVERENSEEENEETEGREDEEGEQEGSGEEGERDEGNEEEREREKPYLRCSLRICPGKGTEKLVGGEEEEMTEKSGRRDLTSDDSDLEIIGSRRNGWDGCRNGKKSRIYLGIDDDREEREGFDVQKYERDSGREVIKKRRLSRLSKTVPVGDENGGEGEINNCMEDSDPGKKSGKGVSTVDEKTKKSDSNAQKMKKSLFTTPSGSESDDAEVEKKTRKNATDYVERGGDKERVWASYTETDDENEENEENEEHEEHEEHEENEEKKVYNLWKDEERSEDETDSKSINDFIDDEVEGEGEGEGEGECGYPTIFPPCFEDEDLEDDFQDNNERSGVFAWSFLGDFQTSLANSDILCMRAMACLYRQQTEEERCAREANFLNRRGFDSSEARRASEVAEKLIGGAGISGTVEINPLKLSSEEIEFCGKTAMKHATQLFAIYQGKEDPYFPDS